MKRQQEIHIFIFVREYEEVEEDVRTRLESPPYPWEIHSRDSLRIWGKLYFHHSPRSPPTHPSMLLKAYCGEKRFFFYRSL